MKSEWIFKTHGASNHTAEEREPHDYYATHPEAVEALLQKEKFSCNILEPACGGGHIAEVLKQHGHAVVASDLYEHGYGNAGLDFFRYAYVGNADIITNPPYKRAAEFAEHAMDIIGEGHKVAMFLKIQFLESEKRQRLFKKYPPAKVYVFIKRQQVAKAGDFKTYNGNAVCYAWFVWIKGYQGSPIIEWI